MKNQNHLSLYGIGSFYAGVSGLLTVTACLLEKSQLLPSLSFQPVGFMLKLVSIVCFFAAATLWLNVLFAQKIDSHIMNNELVTTGAYAWIRNPIYSAIMLVMWAVLAWTWNLYLLLLCPVHPILRTVFLKQTEEKWLTEQYGQACI